MDEEVLLKNADSYESFLASVVDVLLVVGITTNERTEPSTDRREDLVVGIRHPSNNRCVVLLSLTEEARLLVLRGDFVALACAFSHKCSSSNVAEAK